MRVFVRDSAYADLERIYRWIAQNSPTAAKTVAQTIAENTERLGSFPRMGHAGAVRGTVE
jgi:plasmid stabilization system protein ParE